MEYVKYITPRFSPLLLLVLSKIALKYLRQTKFSRRYTCTVSLFLLIKCFSEVFIRCSHEVVPHEGRDILKRVTNLANSFTLNVQSGLFYALLLLATAIFIPARVVVFPGRIRFS